MWKKALVIIGLILLAALSRFIPHLPWNWTAVGSLALLGGARFGHPGLGLVAPVLAMAVSDALIGFHDTIPWVYGGFALVALLSWFFRSSLRGWRIPAAAVAGAVVFYLVSNWGVWVQGTLYPVTAAGLVECYIAGLPFLASDVMGNLFYSVILFFAWDGVTRRIGVTSSSGVDRRPGDSSL